MKSVKLFLLFTGCPWVNFKYLLNFILFSSQKQVIFNSKMYCLRLFIFNKFASGRIQNILTGYPWSHMERYQFNENLKLNATEAKKTKSARLSHNNNNKFFHIIIGENNNFKTYRKSCNCCSSCSVMLEIT